MEDTITCPKCYMENAYHDGVVFACPDCDFEWYTDAKTLSTSYYLDGYSKFEELTKLKVPFFKLEHGKLYDCKVEHENGIEETSIIPLAFQKGKNLQFILTDARRLFTNNPTYVREIINMDYSYISNDGIRADYPFEYEALTIVCSTKNDKTIICYSGSVYFDFKRTDEI
ncbi:hypothetical protein [Phnomibacter ginsenosidimutans]|uniref:Ig-like domain-containing protein n=1 Tax=Phnomibacter ginsenosidimutans TaxID=2676868 RepID=A0A6I6H2W0_9BACT|nr:hypothetical protein [Phnomibacter ginsenosidimutans]QGW28901.1 hypothetical protein GLV81_13060 [Phnomibacter ginsenosidimutans]